MMLKKGLLCLMMLFMITGCASQTGKKDFTSTIHKIEQGLAQSDIASLKILANEIKHLYDKNEWKIHLLGDEGEYERLNESINRFIAAIEEEELSDAKIELATLKTIIHDIYSL